MLFFFNLRTVSRYNGCIINDTRDISPSLKKEMGSFILLYQCLQMNMESTFFHFLFFYILDLLKRCKYLQLCFPRHSQACKVFPAPVNATILCHQQNQSLLLVLLWMTIVPFYRRYNEPIACPMSNFSAFSPFVCAFLIPAFVLSSQTWNKST